MHLSGYCGNAAVNVGKKLQMRQNSGGVIVRLQPTKIRRPRPWRPRGAPRVVVNEANNKAAHHGRQVGPSPDLQPQQARRGAAGVLPVGGHLAGQEDHVAGPGVVHGFFDLELHAAGQDIADLLAFVHEKV